MKEKARRAKDILSPRQECNLQSFSSDFSFHPHSSFPQRRKLIGLASILFCALRLANTELPKTCLFCILLLYLFLFLFFLKSDTKLTSPKNTEMVKVSCLQNRERFLCFETEHAVVGFCRSEPLTSLFTNFQATGTQRSLKVLQFTATTTETQTLCPFCGTASCYQGSEQSIHQVAWSPTSATELSVMD